jgi:PKD repeat protein/pimeloyl-ACP methyl ester carboxylesterase
MKRKIIWSALWALLPAVAFAQADLVVTAAGFAPEQIDKGDIFTLQVFVENAGNTASDANYMFIYYSDDLEIADEEIVSRVSIKPLEPGESQEIFFAYPIAPSLPSGDYFIGFEVDPFNDVPELDEENLFCASQGGGCATFNITSNEVAYQKYTYPMIFIHGWTGNDETWDDFNDEAEAYYGWSFGGRLDYCLNPDGDQSTSDGFYLDLVDEASLQVGDYYRVNYDISADEVLYVGNDGIGFNDDFSNQSAIVKQGWAVSNAVKRVLELTGAEKVILVGHSMGGLAAREYLQNPNNWQTDGEHHVAKLLTVGTPNGGSNLSGGNLGGILNGLDEFSEAVRDLRWKNFLFDGDYLDGGVEDNFSVYYNNDIDCNGFVGDLITGLNQKTSPSDLDYACIVGIGNNLPSLSGDGVVAEGRADLNNYLLATPPLMNQHADRYDVTTAHTSIHKENHSTMIRGLDEPDFYETAYPVPLNSFNLGFSTAQAPNHPIPNSEVDWDDYRIEVSTSGTLTVNVLNIPVHQFAIFLLDENFNILEQVDPTGESNLFYSVDIDPGIYYVEVASIPTPNSWRFPYAYDIFFEPSEPLVASFTANQQEGCVPFTVNFTETSTGGAETFLWSFEGGTPASSSSPNPVVTYNEPGVYPVTLTVNTNTAQASTSENAFISVDVRPEAAFTYEVQQDRTVDFSNQTIFALEQPSYSWDFGDGLNSSLPAPTHTYTNDGIYQVELQASNNCGTTTSEQSVEIVTVSNEIEEIHLGLKSFPVPTKDIVNIEIDGTAAGLCQLELINQLGQKVHSVNVYKSNSYLNVPIHLNRFPAGIYVVRLSLKDFVADVQVIKE